MEKQHQSTCGFISGKVFKPEWERIVPFMPAFKCLKIIDFSYKQMIIASVTYLMEGLLLLFWFINNLSWSQI